MKQIITLALLLVGFSTQAQYPLEWSRYTNDGYFYDIERGINSEQIDEIRFRNDLLNLARSNLSKQIQVKVEEISQLDKISNNGVTDIQYASSVRFTTDLELKFAKTESYTDIVTGEIFVIAFINKREACQCYENEIQMLLRKVDNAEQIAENYERQGFKMKAKVELQQALSELNSADEIFFWLNILGMPEQQLRYYVDQTHGKEQSLKSKLAGLEHGVTYCIVCVADSFGKSYTKLANEVKGGLSASGCSFTEDPAAADYVIQINASAREYNKANIGGSAAYFVFVDAAIAIEKTATGQLILEDEISVKGSHTLGFEEAAREAYKNTSQRIVKLLLENIEL